MNHHLRISDISFHLYRKNGAEAFAPPPQFLDFSVNGEAASCIGECTLEYQLLGQTSPASKGQCIIEKNPCVHFDAETATYIYDAFGPIGALIARASIEQEWKHVVLQENVSLTPKPFFLGQLLVLSALPSHGAITFHASGIDYKGHGIIFSAPSETGKSTQATIWEKEAGALIFNHDRVAVTCRGSEAIAHGLPWGGSSDITLNHHVPLRAIILLEQAPSNTIEQLAPIQSLPYLLAYAYFARWDETQVDRAFSVLQSIVERVPVFRLACRPEPAAMELVRTALSLPKL